MGGCYLGKPQHPSKEKYK
jgi:hypothetical protein